MGNITRRTRVPGKTTLWQFYFLSALRPCEHLNHTRHTRHTRNPAKNLVCLVWLTSARLPVGIFEK